MLTSTLGLSPTVRPPHSDRPPAIESTGFARSALATDSLLARGATLAALDGYRRLEQNLRSQSPVDPDNLGWVWHRMAMALDQSGQPRAATAQLDTLIAAFPNSRWAVLAHRDAGHRLGEAGRYREALSHFRLAADRAEGEEAGQLAFRVAYCYQKLAQWQDAVQWYDRARTQYPILSDYALYYAAQCLTRLGRSEEAITRCRTVMAEYPHSPFIKAVARLTIDRLIASGRYDDTLNESRALLQGDHQLKRAETAEVLASIGQAHAGTDRPDSALAVFRTVLIQYRDTPAALSVLTKFYALKARKQEQITEEERFWGGLVHLENRSYQGAIQTFRTLIQSAPTSPYIPDASYSIGRCLYLLGQYRKAEQEFQRFLSRYPRHDRAGAAALHIARCVRQIRGDKKALEAYLRFIKTYPQDPSAADALWYVGRQLELLTRFQEAAQHYRQLWDEHPQHESAEEARWREGFCSYQLKRFKHAAETFSSLAAARPASRIADRAWYWTAKAQHRDQRLNEARASYAKVSQAHPESYYAYRARHVLAVLDQTPLPRELRGVALTAPAVTVPPSFDITALLERFRRVENALAMQGVTDPQAPAAPPSLVEAVHLDRARALLSVGLLDEAETELTYVQDANPTSPLALAEITGLYYEYRLYRQGIRTAALLRRLVEGSRDAARAQVPPLLLYPVPYWTLIQREATDHGLDPVFLLAVMRQESRFDRWITSWAGARGLMQLMPKTARQLARQDRVQDFTTDRLYEPEISIRLGARFLQEQLGRFGGRPELALAAYNGGPGRVSRWLKKQDASDIDEFIERMDVGETRDFVKVVMDNYVRYAQLLSEEIR